MVYQSRAWAHVKWEEDVASRAKAQQKHDQKLSREMKSDREEGSHPKPAKESNNKSMGIYQNRPLDGAEGMMGQQVKWRQKMKTSDSNRNPNRWCDVHSDHGKKTEHYVALRIEVNELLRKGHLREFISNKAKNLLNKDTANQPTKAVLASPPR
ncbi:hypothetical protein DY000_02015676 [Brassica cretica]|uniref:Uncharacterized protein n=1 Tax=Brassica cretica TaxID=69181 RepID=A0ABQ7D3M9_BRACR|nr:hypothetical protein DY000_02015676 [Brassica cretica]